MWLLEGSRVENKVEKGFQTRHQPTWGWWVAQLCWESHSKISESESTEGPATPISAHQVEFGVKDTLDVFNVHVHFPSEPAPPPSPLLVSGVWAWGAIFCEWTVILQAQAQCSQGSRKPRSAEETVLGPGCGWADTRSPVRKTPVTSFL